MTNLKQLSADELIRVINDHEQIDKSKDRQIDSLKRDNNKYYFNIDDSLPF